MSGNREDSHNLSNHLIMFATGVYWHFSICFVILVQVRESRPFMCNISWGAVRFWPKDGRPRIDSDKGKSSVITSLTLRHLADWERHPRGNNTHVPPPYQEGQQRLSCQGEGKIQGAPTEGKEPETLTVRRNSFSHTDSSAPKRTPT